MVTEVREWTRLRNTQATPDLTVRRALHNAYRQLVQALTAKYRDHYRELFRPFVLDAVWTGLPAQIGTVLSVEEVTGLAADVQGVERREVPTYMITRAGHPGYAISARAIALAGLDWTGRSLGIYHRPDIEEFADFDQERVPRFIDPMYHDAIMWRACLMLASRDTSDVDRLREEAMSSEINMFAGMKRPNKFFT